MQVITPATLDQFQNALGLAARTRPEIATGCHAAGDIVLKVAQAYHRCKTAWPAQIKAASLSDVREIQAENDRNFFGKRCKIRLCYEDSQPVGGYIVLEGELLGLHNLRRGKGDWMLEHAVLDGADRLDTLAVRSLLALYERHGFKQVSTEPNWNPDLPDVVWFRR